MNKRSKPSSAAQSDLWIRADNPFSLEEITSIVDCIDANQEKKQIARMNIRAAARRFIIVSDCPNNFAREGRDNLINIKNCAEQFYAMLENMHGVASATLAEVDDPRIGHEITHCTALGIEPDRRSLRHITQDTVGAFIAYCDDALGIAAKYVNDGRPTNDSLRRFYDDARKIYFEATESSRGFWPYFSAVCAPLEKFGLPQKLCSNDDFQRNWIDATRKRGPPNGG